MSFLSPDDITPAEHYAKQTVVRRWLILMLYGFQGLGNRQHSSYSYRDVILEKCPKCRRFTGARKYMANHVVTRGQHI